MDSGYRYGMEKTPVPLADDAAAVERIKQLARDPLIPRDAPAALLAALSRLVDASVPAAGIPEFQEVTMTAEVAAGLKQGLLEGLAERDAADFAEPRRAEMPARVDAALTAVTTCIDSMRMLESQRDEIAATAIREGFILEPDGSIGLAPQDEPADRDGHEVQLRRARLEGRMMSILAEIVTLQVGTVATIRERLGADQPGVPWVILECARGGHDLGPTFAPGAQLPASPLRDLMAELVAAAEEAKNAVWPTLA